MRKNAQKKAAEPSAELPEEPAVPSDFDDMPHITIDYDAICAGDTTYPVASLQKIDKLEQPFTVDHGTGTIHKQAWDHYNDPPVMFGKHVVMFFFGAAITDGVTIVVPRTGIEKRGNVFAAYRRIIGWIGEKPSWPTAGLLVPTEDLLPQPTNLAEAWDRCPLELVAMIEEYVPNDLYAGTIAYCKNLDLCPTHRPIRIGKYECAIQGELLEPPMACMPPGEMIGETFYVSITKFPCDIWAPGGTETVFDRFNPDGRAVTHLGTHDYMFGQDGIIYVAHDNRWCRVKNTHAFIQLQLL
jgi:hypothetical protein